MLDKFKKWILHGNNSYISCSIYTIYVSQLVIFFLLIKRLLKPHFDASADPRLSRVFSYYFTLSVSFKRNSFYGGLLRLCPFRSHLRSLIYRSTSVCFVRKRRFMFWPQYFWNFSRTSDFKHMKVLICDCGNFPGLTSCVDSCPVWCGCWEVDFYLHALCTITSNRNYFKIFNRLQCLGVLN